MDGLRFPNVRVLEDCLFSSSAMLRAKSVAITDFPGYYYRVRSDSAVQKLPPGRDSCDDLVEVFAALENWFVENRRVIDGDVGFNVRPALATFVYDHLMMCGVSHRRVVPDRRVVPERCARYKIVARQLRRLEAVGGLPFSCLPFGRRMPLFLFVRTGCRGGLMLNRKVEEGGHKAQCAWQRFLSRWK